MKTFGNALFLFMLSAAVTAADAPPPLAATSTIELAATSVLVPADDWNDLSGELQSYPSEEGNEALISYVGDTAQIRAWYDRLLQQHQAILVFEVRGRTSDGRAWQIDVGPRLELVPTAGADDLFVVDVGYRPAASDKWRRSGELPVPHGQSLVLKTNAGVDPVPLLVISVGNANELVTIRSDWPVSHAATVPRSAAAANPLAEIVSAADPATSLNDDVQFFPAGPEFTPEDSSASDPDIETVTEVTAPSASAVQPASTPGTPPAGSGDVRFYPGIGPASLNVSAAGDVELVRQPDVSVAGRYIELTAGEPQTIEMHEHEARRVSLDRKIKSASGFNPDIVDVTASGTNGLHIQSSRAGATRLTIVDEDDVPLELTIIVTRDMTDLELLLKRLYPDANVEVIPIQNTVLLRGTVEGSEEVQQIEEIAEQFVPQVLNQLRVSGDSAVSTIPPGHRVVTVSADIDVDVLKPGEFVDVVVIRWKESDTAAAVVESETLLTTVEVFAVNTRTIGIGGAQSAQIPVVALLVRPDEVEALNLAEEMGDIQLVWRAAANVHSETRLNQELFARLKRQAEEHSRGDAAGYPTSPPGGSPYSGSFVPAVTEVENRVVSIGIGTDLKNLGQAEPGDRIDLLASDPGLASPETIAEGVRLVGVIEPKDEAGRFVWLIVPPDVGERIDAMTVAAGVSFAIRVADDAPAYPSGAAPPAAAWPSGNPYATLPGAPSQPQPGAEPESDLEALRNDIRALHADVRRLIEVLEAQQPQEVQPTRNRARSADENSQHDPMLDEGAAMLFFNATWCGPCQRMLPIVNRLEDDGFAIHTIDVEEQRELVRQFEVTSIPSCVFLYDGDEVDRLIGATTENELRDRLTRASSPEARIEAHGRLWTELGLRIEETPPDVELLSKSPYRGAVQITHVRKGSPAADAGVQVGDLLVGLHVWETISRENVDFVLSHASWSTFSPLKFYVLRDGETLFGHFPQGERTSLEFPRQINDAERDGIVPIAATRTEEVDLLPLPAGSVEPVDDVPAVDAMD